MAGSTRSDNTRRREALRKTSVEDLITRMRAGDRDAGEELFRRCKPRIDAWATRRGVGTDKSSARPSDIAQDTARRAFQGFEKFRGATEGELFAWLKTIFRTCIQESHRFAHRQKRDEGDTLFMDDSTVSSTPNPGASPSQVASRHEAQAQLLMHLSQLPPAQSEVIWRCNLKGTSVAEAAQAMKRTEAAVGGLLQRGLKTLKRRMTEGSAAYSVEGSQELAPRNETATALVVYLSRRSAGQIVDRGSFLAEHPGCADELRSILDWLGHIETIWAEP